MLLIILTTTPRTRISILELKNVKVQTRVKCIYELKLLFYLCCIFILTQSVQTAVNAYINFYYYFF